MMTEQLLRLPEKPGTVIAIGDWWLVRLRPYETGAKSWELLPFRSEAEREHAERIGVKAQCVYGDEWVLAEAEQEGGYLVIADPREEPSGIQYFKPSPLARAAKEETIVDIPVGARVYLRAVDTVRGMVEQQNGGGYVDVRWDHGGATKIGQDYIGPEAALPSERTERDRPRNMDGGRLG